MSDLAARFAWRADKALTENRTHSLIESFKIRPNKVGGREAYLGVLAIAKAANHVRLARGINNALFKKPYKKIGGGGEQIALTHQDKPQQVIKVDRISLYDTGNFPARRKKLEANLAFLLQNYDDTLAYNSHVSQMESPFLGDRRQCLVTVQPLVSIESDILKIDASSWESLQSRAPKVGGQLLQFVEATDTLLRDNTNKFLPDIMGPSNLVAGSLLGETGILLVDQSPTSKHELVNPVHSLWTSALDEYKSRLEYLSDLALVA